MKRQLAIITITMVAIPVFAAGVAPNKYTANNDLRSGKTETVSLNGKTYKLGETKRFRTRQTPMPTTDIIYEAQGTEKLYNKEAAGTFVLGGQLDQYWDEFPVSVVWGANNTVYFKDIISTTADNTYVKGTLDGNTITLPLNQTILFDEEYQVGLNIGVLKTEVEGEYINFYYDPSFTQVTFTVADNGDMTLNLPGEPFNGEEAPQYVLGIYYTDDLSFYGFSDYFQSYEFKEMQAITMPADVEPLEYVFIDDFNYADIVNVAYKGNELFIQGLLPGMPNAVVKAYVSGNTAYIPQNEYLGIYYDAYFIFTKVLYENPAFDENDPQSPYYIMAPADVVFNLKIDKEAGTIIADTPGVYLSFQPDEDSWENSIMALSEFILRYQETAAGTPAPPTDLRYSIDWVDYQGWNDFFFTLSNFSTQGNLLDVEHLYYSVIVDGEQIIFGERQMENLKGDIATVYPNVPGEQIWLPYEFMNNEDIFKYSDNEFDIGIYKSFVTTVGVQSMYIYEGETTYSDIVTYNVKTGELTTEPAGIDSVAAGGEVVKREYYNLGGLKVNNPDSGFYIIRETHDDGTVTSRKIMKRY